MQQRRDEPKTSGGSPDLKCDRTVGQAATGISSPEEINVSPVPLFLVPRAVADEIRRHGAMLFQERLSVGCDGPQGATFRRNGAGAPKVRGQSLRNPKGFGQEFEHRQVRGAEREKTEGFRLRAVREINVRRTRNHQYEISVERGRP